MARGYDIEDLAEAMGVDPEDLAEDLGYSSLEAAEYERADMSFGDISDWDPQDLAEYAPELAELWDVDISDVYDMYYGYEVGSHGS